MYTCNIEVVRKRRIMKLIKTNKIKSDHNADRKEKRHVTEFKKPDNSLNPRPQHAQ